VSSYIVTKGMAAGAMMLALAFPTRGARQIDLLAGGVALLGIFLTAVLLISDLERPERFHRLLTRPQWRSWLTRGAVVINLAAALAALWTLAAALRLNVLRDDLRWAIAPAGALLAGYTALLLAQCEGRDLWQGRLTAPITLVNSVLAGAGALSLLAPIVTVSASVHNTLSWSLLCSGVVGGALVARDAFGPHPTGQAHRAALNLWRDRFAARFWTGLVLGFAAPTLCAAGTLAGAGWWLSAAGGACTLAGLWSYEDAWVAAGQSVPLS
jgi:formate-dependent nitrite reductase membrane component NrfD